MRTLIGRASVAVTLVAGLLTTGAGLAAAAPDRGPAPVDRAVVVDVRNTVFLTPTPPQRVIVRADGLIVTNGDSPSGLVQLRGSRADVADLRAIAEGVLRNRPAVNTALTIYDGSAVDATVRAANGQVLRATVDNPEPRGWPALGSLSYDLRKRIFAIPGERTRYVESR